MFLTLTLIEKGDLQLTVLYENRCKLSVMHVFSIFASKFPSFLAIGHIFEISEIVTHA